MSFFSPYFCVLGRGYNEHPGFRERAAKAHQGVNPSAARQPEVHEHKRKSRRLASPRDRFLERAQRMDHRAGHRFLNHSRKRCVDDRVIVDDEDLGVRCQSLRRDIGGQAVWHGCADNAGRRPDYTGGVFSISGNLIGTNANPGANLKT